MKSVITRSGFVALAFVSVILLINGCKKNDVVSSDTETLLEKSKAWAAKQTQFTTHVMNEKLETYRVDENGNRVTSSFRTNSTGAGCYPAIEPSVTWNSWAATNPQCSPNNYYQIYSSFTISSQNAIVAANPNNANQKTRGRVIVTNTSTGASVYTNNSVLPLSITDLGVDPNDPTRHLYSITWTAQSVPSTVFSGSNTIRVGLYYFTECEEESQWPYQVIANLSNLGGLTACNVVSYVTIDFVNHYIHGLAASTNCNPDIVPTKQEVEFSRSGFVWTKKIDVTDSYIPTTTELPRGYTYSVKYRNVMGDPTVTCNGPWLQPVLSLYW